MRLQQTERRSEAIIRDAENPDLTVILRNIFDQPVDSVVCVGSFNEIRGVVLFGRVRHLEDAFRFESSANVLKDNDVTVVHQLFPGGPGKGLLVLGNAVWSALHQDGEWF